MQMLRVRTTMIWLVAWTALAFMCCPSVAADRVALVIGNNAYLHMSRLDNPVRDATAVAKVFRDNGFKVIEKLDIDRADFLDAVDELRREAQGAEVAVVFYAGHGGEVAGRDVLAPKDLRYSCETKSLERAVRVSDVVDAIGGAKKKVLILDACRNEPFPQCPSRGAGGAGFRSLGKLDGAGMIIANSTSPGSVAADGPAGSHSPFAQALVNRLSSQPREKLMRIMLQVSKDVHEQSNGEQTPEVSLRGAEPEACLAVEGCGVATPLRASADTIERVRASTVTVYAFAPPAANKADPKIASLPPEMQKFFEDAFPKKSQDPLSMGTGFFISDQRHIVTTDDVVKGAEKIEIQLQGSKRRYTAELVGQDQRSSLAVLKVTGDQPMPPALQFTARKPQFGEPAFAVSNSRGQFGAVNLGSVTNVLAEADALQIDAVVQKGAAGAPVADVSGTVLGIVSVFIAGKEETDPSGLNKSTLTYAISATRAAQVTRDIIERGKVEQGWFGAAIKSVTTDDARSLNLKEPVGVYLFAIPVRTPADDAGFKRKDVVLAVNDEPVEGTADFLWRITRQRPGTVVKLKIWRDGAEQVREVTLGRFEPKETPASTANSTVKPTPTAPLSEKKEATAPSGVIARGGPTLGLTLKPDSDIVFGEKVQGLRVMALPSNSSASAKGVVTGDLNLEINATPITSVADAERLIADSIAIGRRSALFKIGFGGKSRYVALDLR